ncbi:MAG: gamma-glutamylcyclotransferase family protein [Solirubrobacteraceae bacterium]
MGRWAHGGECVFGYGSLAVRAHRTAGPMVWPEGFVAQLRDARRIWGVAMDNRRDLPGYKYYTDPAGSRPPAFVAFLDLVFGDGMGATVGGRCLPVNDRLLAELDRRERNYRRIDVTDRIDVSEHVAGADARVWTYVGTAAGRERLREGRRTGTAVIDAHYLQAVRAGLAALRTDDARTLDTDGIPVAELIRHDLP